MNTVARGERTRHPRSLRGRKGTVCASFNSTAQTPRGVATLLALLLGLVSAVAAAGAPLRIAVISDLNGSYGSTDYHTAVATAVNEIIALQPDLVISTGDMVGGQRRPHLSQQQIGQMWEAFDAAVSQALAAAGIPLAVTPGNHDASAYDGFQRERRIYADHWLSRRPKVQFLDDAAYPFHYAFEADGVLFVSLDATTVGALPTDQLEWLRQILVRHGPEYRVRVVFSHVPLWPFAQGREREFMGDPELQLLLQEHKVDLFLSGHHHAFYPGVKDGVTFVSQACLGAGPRRLIGSPAKSVRSFTVLEFNGDDIRIAAREGPGFTDELDWRTLPERIRSPVAELIRADLAEVPSN